jgi:CheY-like chemotaxis protein
MPHTLLLADDSLAIQRVVELTFAGEDVRVVAVGDGQQAIERMSSDPPDIVLADIAMPLADGYAVAEFMRSSPTMRDVPVLLLAGAFDIVEESRLGASGARGVLVKPFEPHVVISRVKELLGLTPAGDTPPSTEAARLVTSPEPPRPVRTLSSDPPFWRQPEATHATQAEPVVAAPAPTAEAVPASAEEAAQATPAPYLTLDADAISSAMVDRIAARVVEQLGERLRNEVTEVVLNVSERLVREEIQRIRDAADSRDPSADP